ncbi:MAG: hypothetical protein AAFO77_01925 [Pseudomonadota bacterium]
MLKTIILFYSLTGNTAKVAEDMAKMLKADIEEIHETKERRGLWGYLTGLFTSLGGGGTDVEPPDHRFGDYDLVIVGSPVWARQLAAPMRKFLEREKTSISDHASFCLHSGLGFKRAQVVIDEVLGRPAAARFDAKETDIRSEDYWKRLRKFCESLDAKPS